MTAPSVFKLNENKEQTRVTAGVVQNTALRLQIELTKCQNSLGLWINWRGIDNLLQGNVDVDWDFRKSIRKCR